MIKFLIALLIGSVCFGSNNEMTIRSVTVNLNKTIYLYDEIEAATYENIKSDMYTTEKLKGNRLLVISSNGGSMIYGERILELIKKEQKNGTKYVCYVEDKAASMAFNILSNCDVIVAHPKSKLLFHKIRFYFRSSDHDITVEFLKKMISETQPHDAAFDKQNLKRLKIDKAYYDDCCRKNKVWTAKELKDIGYIDEIMELNI